MRGLFEEFRITKKPLQSNSKTALEITKKDLILLFLVCLQQRFNLGDRALHSVPCLQFY